MASTVSADGIGPTADCCVTELVAVHSEKFTKFCKISTLLLSYVVPVKRKVEILQNSEYMIFNLECHFKLLAFRPYKNLGEGKKLRIFQILY